MDFVYRVLWILKALWIVLSETINILRKVGNFFFGGDAPQKIYQRFMPFKLILRSFEVNCFLMSGVRMLHFLKFIQNPPILYYGFKIWECLQMSDTSYLWLLVTMTSLNFEVICVHMALNYEWGPTPTAHNYQPNHKIPCGLKCCNLFLIYKFTQVLNLYFFLNYKLTSKLLKLRVNPKV